MKPILEVCNISKRYTINQSGSAGYLSLRDSVSGLFKFKSSTKEIFSALDDISFNVYPGDSIGVVGKNGAGKSTLLKVLSKITPPSSGKIISRGRIASLLEVGTGFHPELTGRENVYLNGSILGLSKKEIEKHFDAIVDFSGIEQFIDTPLKHYSSGMQLRLAFAVAAHLEPEILIIDEVLAVGDAEFQKKCIGKMEDVSKSGRTILFVSHNMAAIESLCNKAILLSKGKLIDQGLCRDITNKYVNINTGESKGENGVLVIHDHDRSSKIIKQVEILVDDRLSSYAYMGCNLKVKVFFNSNEKLDYPVLGVIIRDVNNMPILGINNKSYQDNLIVHPINEAIISMEIPYLQLMSGYYSMDIRLGNAFKDIHILNDCISFQVESASFSKQGMLPDEKINKFFIKEVYWNVN